MNASHDMRIAQAFKWLVVFAQIGEFIVCKYNRRVHDVESLRAQDEDTDAQSGYFVVAKQLRKQGIPLEIALLILFPNRKQ